MARSDSDLWHFIFNDRDGTWCWRRVAVTGDVIAESQFRFQSFNVCVADAERAGYVRDVHPGRRAAVSDAEPLTARRKRLDERRQPRP